MASLVFYKHTRWWHRLLNTKPRLLVAFGIREAGLSIILTQEQHKTVHATWRGDWNVGRRIVAEFLCPATLDMSRTLHTARSAPSPIAAGVLMWLVDRNLINWPELEAKQAAVPDLLAAVLTARVFAKLSP